MKLSNMAMEEINELIDMVDKHNHSKSGGFCNDIIEALKSIHGYLAIIDAEGDREEPPEETEYQKAIRTGIKPEIWPPIVMTPEDLEHFRSRMKIK